MVGLNIIGLLVEILSFVVVVSAGSWKIFIRFSLA